MIIDLICERMEYEHAHPDNTYNGYLEFINSPDGQQAKAEAERHGGFIPAPYHPNGFYLDVLRYHNTKGDDAERITVAMDYGDEKAVKKALNDYITNNNYNPDICDYINGVKWLVSA